MNKDTDLSTATLEQLKAWEKQWKQAQWDASQARSAAGVGQANRQLIRIWREIDRRRGK